MTSWSIYRRGGMRIDYRCGHHAHRIAVFLHDGPAGHAWFVRNVPRPAESAHDCPDCLLHRIEKTPPSGASSIDHRLRPLEP